MNTIHEENTNRIIGNNNRERVFFIKFHVDLHKTLALILSAQTISMLKISYHWMGIKWTVSEAI